jgi:hypothetical protein
VGGIGVGGIVVGVARETSGVGLGRIEMGVGLGETDVDVGEGGVDKGRLQPANRKTVIPREMIFAQKLG